MSKSNAQKKAEDQAKALEEEMTNDPGKSPSDVNKDSSGAAPVTGAFQGGASPVVDTDEG